MGKTLAKKPGPVSDGRDPEGSKSWEKDYAWTRLPERGEEKHPSLVRVNGRPRIRFDLEQLEKLARTHLTDTEIAAYFNVGRTTFQDRKAHDPAFRAALEAGRAVHAVKLRKVQFRIAIRDRNPTMAIWLGRQHLGQKEQIETANLHAFVSPTREAMLERMKRAEAEMDREDKAGGG